VSCEIWCLVKKKDKWTQQNRSPSTYVGLPKIKNVIKYTEKVMQYL